MFIMIRTYQNKIKSLRQINWDTLGVFEKEASRLHFLCL